MNSFWNQRTRRLKPYVPGEQPQDRQYIKLNTNENPQPPSQPVRAAMHAAVDEELNLYPDPNCQQLKNQIAKYYALKPENVFIGNGSDEVLAHIFAGLFDPNKPLLSPDISYSFYPVYARLYDLTLQAIPLDTNFKLKLDNYTDNNGGVIFANPNAPTSIALKREVIEKFLRQNTQSTVVVDEAYVDFGTQTCAPLINKYANLLVVQTLSKSRSLAGLRLGFALGDAGLIQGLERIKNSFNSYPVDKVALAGAQAAIADIESFEKSRLEIMRRRDDCLKALRALDFHVLNSATNFLFASPQFMDAQALYKALKEKGILVRHFNQPRICDYLRITVGTQQEMDALLTCIRAIKHGQ